MNHLADKEVVLGVCGSIAAYKALWVLRLLREAGARVTPVLSAGAQHFVTPLCATALAGRPAITDPWDAARAGTISHVELAHAAQVVVVAPASANALARLAQGMADDALSALALATAAPLVLAPAMETHMWQHPAVVANVQLLLQRGATLVPPELGVLASGRMGEGRLAEPACIVAAARAAVTPQDLRGWRLLITAGPTREALDPARFLSNASTGKMGFALARAAHERGAAVQLVCGPTSAAPPAHVACDVITTTDELLAACQAHLPQSHAVIMAAAPADFRAVRPATHKVKKADAALTVELAATPDVLAALAPQMGGRVAVGFAAETEALLEHGHDKLRRKHLDMLVANPIGRPDRGFAADINEGWLLRPDAPPLPLRPAPKAALAHTILDHLVPVLARKQPRAGPAAPA